MAKHHLALLLVLVSICPAARSWSSVNQESPDVVFTQRILEKAEELGNNPVRIYQFVRNELEYQNYFGLMKGPEGTLLSGGGNDYDLAALLVSFLRASGTPARFVRGRISVPVADAAAWLGVDNGNAAVAYLVEILPPSWDGLVLDPTIADSKLSLIHIWVEAQIPMAKYRGAGVDGDDRGLAWIPLDPSFKLSDWPTSPGVPIGTPPLDLALNTGPDSLYRKVHAKLPVELYEDKVRAHLASTAPAGRPPMSVDDLLLKGTIRREEPGVIPSSLPYEISSALAPRRAASLADLHENPTANGWPEESGEDGIWEYRWLQSIHVCEHNVKPCQSQPTPNKLIERWDWSANWEGKRVVLTSRPASSNLRDTGYSHCNGTNGNPVRIRPTLKVDGQILAEAPVRDLCSPPLEIAVGMSHTLIGNSVSQHTEYAGGMYLAGFDSHATSPARVDDAARELVAAREEFPIAFHNGQPFVDNQPRNGVKNGTETYLALDFDAQDALTGGLLELANAWYYAKARQASYRIFALFQERPVYLPAAGMVSAGRTVSYAFELPYAIAPSNLLIDIKSFLIPSAKRSSGQTPVCCDGSFELAGHQSSALESATWEELSGFEAISTVKGFQVYKEMTGRNIHSYTKGEMEDLLSGQCTINEDDPCDASLIDIEGYCIAKKAFATQSNYYAATYDAICPGFADPAVRTGELRLNMRADMNYHGWKGQVYYKTYGAPGGPLYGASFTISPDQAAGGGYLLEDYPVDPLSDDFAFLDDPHSGPYTYDRDSWGKNDPSFQKNYGGDPVSVLNGNYYTIETDLEIAGRGGMNLRLVRSYNSRLEYEGPLGHGWIHTYDQHLRFEGNEVIWLTETGAEITWDSPSSNSPLTLTPLPWCHDTLVRNADQSYTLTTKNGFVYRFLPQSAGKSKLSSITDRNGNSITATYSAGVLDFVTDTAGRKLDFNYDATGYLSTIDDGDWFGGSAGRQWRYQVDANHNLVEYMDPVQSARDAAIPGSGERWRYTYYSDSENARLDHNLKCWIKPQGGREGGVTPNPCGHAAAEGRSWMFFSYYSNDTVYQHSDSLGNETTFSYNYLRKRTDVIHPDGGVEAHHFDPYGNIIRFETEGGAVREYVFDAPKRQVLVERDEFGLESTATYDELGNQLSRTDRMGETESWTYNEFGQPTSHTNRRGHFSEWKYDSRGNLLRELAQVGGKLRLLSEHRYDSYGNRTQMIRHNDPAGELPPARVRFDYKQNGVGVARAVDAFDKIVRFEVDELGRTTHVEKDRTVWIDGKKVLRPIGIDVAYDELDRETTTTGPGSLVFEIDYDANGLVVARHESVPSQSPGAPPQAERTTVFNEYGAMDRLIETKNALGEETTLDYDARDRVIRITSPLGHRTTRQYDLDGNRTRETDPSGAMSLWEYDAASRLVSAIDPMGRVTATEYDREGRPTKLSQVLPGGPARILQRFEYDEEGNAKFVFDGEGNKSTQVFDELGRIISVTGPPVTNRFNVTQSPTTEMQYDLGGRLVTREDPEGRIERVRYDVVGRVIETSDGLGRKRFFEYDQVGNLLARVDPMGHAVRFQHDERGLVLHRYSANDASIDDRYTYDGFGRLLVARNDDAIIRSEYDVLDRLVSVTDSEAGTARFVYDADGRLVQRTFPDGALGFPQGIGIHYQYDDRGLLSSIFDPVAGTWRLEYDAIGRPVRRTDPSGLEEHVAYTSEGFVDEIVVRDSTSALLQRHSYSNYDVLGNPGAIERDDGGSVATTTVVYDALSRVRSANYGAESEEFDYDLAGNRTFHRTRAGTPHVYQVDAANQLTRITNESSGAVAQSFDYDTAGRLVAIRNGGATAPIAEQLVYDALGRLSAYGRATPGYAMALEYDATDSRRRRLDGGEHHYFAGGLEWHDETRVRLVRGAGLDATVAEVRESEVVGLFHDGGNSITAASSGGAIALRRKYDAFGTLQNVTGSAAVERGFAGLAAEGESPLLYARARHYDPRYGRFLQRDPLGIEADQLYAYAANNPFVFFDPTGLAPVGIAPPGFTAIYIPKVGRIDVANELVLGWAGQGLPDYMSAPALELKLQVAQQVNQAIGDTAGVLSLATAGGPAALALRQAIGGATARGTQQLLPAFTKSTVDDVLASSRLAKGQTTRGASLLEKRIADGTITGVKPTQVNAERVIQDVLNNPLRTRATQRFGQRDVIGESFGQEIGLRINAETRRVVGIRRPDF